MPAKSPSVIVCASRRWEASHAGDPGVGFHTGDDKQSSCEGNQGPDILAKMGNHHFTSGTLIANRFEIDKPAGSGGMGTVYRARDNYSGGVVALKLLHNNLGGPDDSERFAREAQLLSELRHPGIVSYVAHGQTSDGQRFLAMEWLAGEDLGQRLERGPLAVRDCLRLLAQTADALSVAHKCGVIHRDLKPTNLFIVGGDVGCVKILDFGIARRIARSQAMTRTGMLVGTPEYMAPEQARGSRELTPAADLFSLGCVLYECLTGQPPFVADHIAAVLVRILFEEPIPIEDRRPGIPPALIEILTHLLAKEPALRMTDAAMLRERLLGLGELSEPALAVTLAGPPAKTDRFADQQQGLYSVVLAAPPDEDIGLGATQPQSSAQLGPTERQALLAALAALGGSSDFLANGTLVVAVSSLGSAQDQATLAARAALLIQDRWPEAVVSMATGRGTVRDRTAVGEVVELAARSLKSRSHPAAAKPATGVRIDSLSAKLLQGRFVQTPQPDGALLLYEERDVDASRLLLGKPTPCVGREAELATIDALLHNCQEESEAQVVVITAPPGAGKSRLRHEFLRRAAQRDASVTVLLGRGDMMSAGAPYQILGEAVRRLCGLGGGEPIDVQRTLLGSRIDACIAPSEARRVTEFVGELSGVSFPDDGTGRLLAAREDPRIMRSQIRRAFLEWIAAECRRVPVLIVLDDLHWGDMLSVSLLDETLRELRSSPLFVLALARPELHEALPKLWLGNKVQEIHLKGLGKKAAERIVQQVLGPHVSPDVVGRIVAQSDGNALFLEELIRAAAERDSSERPDTVLAMLQARLGRFEAGPRKSVLAASLYGQTFWRGGVAAILGLHKSGPELQAWLGRLVEAEVIDIHADSRLPDEQEYRFRHALVRDAAWGLLTENDRITGHRSAGAFLEAAGEREPAIIARHYEEGGENARAVTFYCRAAEQALGRCDNENTIRWIQRGHACGAEGTQKGHLLAMESYVQVWLDRFDLSYPAASAALQLLPLGGLAWARAMYSAFIASISGLPEWKAQIPALLAQILECDPKIEAEAAYAETLANAMGVLALVAPPAFLRAGLSRLDAICSRASARNPTISRWLLTARGYFSRYLAPTPWTVLQTGLEALALLERAGDLQVGTVVRVFLVGMAYFELGDPEQALAVLQSVHEWSQKNNELAMRQNSAVKLAAILAQNTDSASRERVREYTKEPLASASGHLLFRGQAHDALARVLLQEGNLVEAEAHSRAACQTFETVPNYEPNVQAPLIQALVAQGQRSEAIAICERALGALQHFGGAGHAEVELRLAISEAFHATGQRERAESELRETLRQIQLRLDDIADLHWKTRYASGNPYCVRTQLLAKQWGLDMEVG